jgi:biotin carboxyl carrier protein
MAALPAGALELLLERRGERLLLLAPRVGTFTGARGTGVVLVPGETAGMLLVLGVPHALVVPPGAEGRIASRRPERVHEPVGWGTTLYELEPLRADAPKSVARQPAAAEERGLFVRSPQAGRFWHRAAPGDPPLAAPGERLADGQSVGLIEVMKTFTHVPYRAADGLPAAGRVVRVLVQDGAEVGAGAPLFEVEAV